jgi:hypothetical protein
MKCENLPTLLDSLFVDLLALELRVQLLAKLEISSPFRVHQVIPLGCVLTLSPLGTSTLRHAELELSSKIQNRLLWVILFTVRAGGAGRREERRERREKNKAP